MGKMGLFIWFVVVAAAGVLIGYTGNEFGWKAVAAGIVIFGAGFLGGTQFERQRQQPPVPPSQAE